MAVGERINRKMEIQWRERGKSTGGRGSERSGEPHSREGRAPRRGETTYKSIVGGSSRKKNQTTPMEGGKKKMVRRNKNYRLIASKRGGELTARKKTILEIEV